MRRGIQCAVYGQLIQFPVVVGSGMVCAAPGAKVKSL